MASSLVLVERRGPVAVATLNRPEKHNAMSLAMKDAVVATLGELDADPGVRVVVLTGAGDKSFVAGADIGEFQGRTLAEQLRMYREGTVYDAVDRVAKPLIARIDGYCFGGGLELALACDMRISSERSQFSQAEVNIGIIPGGGGSQRLPRLVGLGTALKLTLTGERIDAQEAHRIGLVDEVVAHPLLEARVEEIANRIASKSAVSVRLAKAAVKASARLPLDQGLRYEQSLFSLAFSSEDKEEGVRAFLEKREPRWKDR
jgi:enoyl-CoA hydratase